MNKYLVIILLLILCLSIPNNGKSECTVQPEKIVENYYKELSTGNLEKGFRYISKDDIKYLVINNDETEKEEIQREILRTTYKLYTWKILSSKLKDGSAEVTVKLKMPDIGRGLGISVGKYLMNEDGLSDFNDIWQQILYNLNAGEYEYMEKIQKIDLKCEDDGWKISLYLEKKQKIRKIVKSALILRKNGKYKEAITKIKQVFEIEKDNELAMFYLERWEKRDKLRKE